MDHNETSETNQLSPASSFSTALINFVNRRCELLNYEPTEVERYTTRKSVCVALTSYTQFPVGIARRTVEVAVAPGKNVQAELLQKVAMELDSMHLGLPVQELEQAMTDASAVRGKKSEGN